MAVFGNSGFLGMAAVSRIITLSLADGTPGGQRKFRHRRRAGFIDDFNCFLNNLTEMASKVLSWVFGTGRAIPSHTVAVTGNEVNKVEIIKTRLSRCSRRSKRKKT